MDALMVDGNAVAGLLQEIFGTDMTTAVGTCGTCGASEQVGAIHVFRGAGTVLRCAHCGNALIKVVTSETRIWIAFGGMRSLEIRRTA
jgi:coenzyme F420-reducing hydrogenase gamma subunit